MTNQWYYGRGADISGPVSSDELIDLAANGKVIPTDTIWRDDIETGVPADRVKNLFPLLEPSVDPPVPGQLNRSPSRKTLPKQ